MKNYYLIFFILILFTNSQVQIDNEDETRGCVILEREGECCWRNSNGCCAPPQEGAMCTQAITICCKIKTYDEETNTYEYEYEHGDKSDIQKIPVDGYYINSIKFNLLLFILILY